jgi:hypothetical protein
VGGCGTRRRNVSASSVSQMSASKRMTKSVPVRQCAQDGALRRHRSAVRRPMRCGPGTLFPWVGQPADRLLREGAYGWDLPVSRGAAAAQTSSRDSAYPRHTTSHLPRLPLPPSPFDLVDDGAGGFRGSLRWRGLFSSTAITARATSTHPGESCRFSSLSSLLKAGKTLMFSEGWKEGAVSKVFDPFRRPSLAPEGFIKGPRIRLPTVNKNQVPDAGLPSHHHRRKRRRCISTSKV